VTCYSSKLTSLILRELLFSVNSCLLNLAAAMSGAGQANHVQTHGQRLKKLKMRRQKVQNALLNAAAAVILTDTFRLQRDA